MTKSVRRAGTAASNAKLTESNAARTDCRCREIRRGARRVMEWAKGCDLVLDKLYFADAGVTKLEVARYFASVALVLLLVVCRCPSGPFGKGGV